MEDYYKLLLDDVRIEEGLTACMNCGICTAVRPAAEFYNYDPRQIVTKVQSKNNKTIEDLLKSETIWYCGECMSCRPRCPRSNTPGYVIQALRTLSQKTGLFVESEKGRQQFALKKTIGEAILTEGYCLYPKLVNPDLHPEQGPVWRWIWENDTEVFEKFTDNYRKAGNGAMRKVDKETIEEINRIFDVSGGTKMFDTIEEHSDRKARELGFEGANEQYMLYTYTTNSGNH